MRILTTDESVWEVRNGHGSWFSFTPPLYSEEEATDAAILLMTEKIRKPMKSRTWVSISKDNKLIRSWKRLEDEVWKEFPVE